MQQIMYRQSPWIPLTYPDNLEAFNTAKWTGWTQQFGARARLELEGNDLLLSRSSSPGRRRHSAGGSSTTLIIVIVVVVIVIAGVAFVLVRRRSSRRFEDEV